MPQLHGRRPRKRRNLPRTRHAPMDTGRGTQGREKLHTTPRPNRCWSDLQSTLRQVGHRMLGAGGTRSEDGAGGARWPTTDGSRTLCREFLCCCGWRVQRRPHSQVSRRRSRPRCCPDQLLSGANVLQSKILDLGN